MKENIQLSDELRAAVKAIKKAILQSQYRAAKSVNREQLSLYYGIGRYISEHSGKGFWGKGAIKQISDQLHKELPGMKGFSETSIKKMRQFYEEWAPSIRQPGWRISTADKSTATAVDLEVVDYESLMKYHQPLTEKFNFEEFVSLSFTHHIEILNKTENLKRDCSISMRLSQTNGTNICSVICSRESYTNIKVKCPTTLPRPCQAPSLPCVPSITYRRRTT